MEIWKFEILAFCQLDLQSLISSSIFIFQGAFAFFMLVSFILQPPTFKLIEQQWFTFGQKVDKCYDRQQDSSWVLRGVVGVGKGSFATSELQIQNLG